MNGKRPPGAFRIDPAFASALAQRDQVTEHEVDPMSSIPALRERAAKRYPYFSALIPERQGVSRWDATGVRPDGSEIALRWYYNETDTSVSMTAGVVYMHGGGMVLGELSYYDRIIERYVESSGVPMLAVDYRLAPENPFPAGMDDCVMGVRWLIDNAERLGVDPDRIAVMGDSGGGGLAASAALFCRDHGLSLSAQLLIYPMLDDRTIRPDKWLEPYIGWNYGDNAAAWSAVLSARGQDQQNMRYAVPAREAHLEGLPRTYLDVGELDIFRREVLEYATRLTDAGVSTELHLHPSVPHGYDLAAPQIELTRRTLADRIRMLRSL
ncbi:alpha/beta hydrolase [Leifsonia kafniensis]|uniref:Alpha/beta hydrolase n=1 Tax=Leifsonia kafniensis TaxID=475957 RepID=A0ABP7KU48_9MICO